MTEPHRSVASVAGSLANDVAWIHHLARHLVRDEHLAADVAQDALVVGLGDSAPAPLATSSRGWLTGVTRMVARQTMRARRERALRELLAARVEGDDPEQRANERLRIHELLTRAIRDLPEPYRTAVTLRYFEGRSARAIARLRQQTPDAVRQHVHRGLGMLRQRLDHEFGARDEWLRAFAGLGLGQPVVPWLPFALTWPTVGAIVVALLGLGAVAAALWTQRAESAADPSVQATQEDRGAELGTAQNPSTTARGPEAPPQDATELTARVDRYLQPLVAMGAFSGTVLLARGDKLVVQRAYGMADQTGTPNDVDTRHKLMSTTKSLTAVAVFRLVQEGKVLLDDSVGKYLPDWPQAWRTVTVHDLLDHTSGIENLEGQWVQVQLRSGTRGLPAWRDMAAQLAAHAPPRGPAESRYSNFNYELLGMVVEAATGQPFRTALRELVLTPAGMQATGFDDGSRPERLAIGYALGATSPEATRQDMSIIQAAGGLWSTVGDLYRFDRALRGDSLLRAATQAQMTTTRPQSPSYACGWGTHPVLGHRCWQHSGGANGFVANLLRFPDDDACVVVLSNFAFAPIMRISQDLAAVLFGAEHSVPVQLSPEQLDAAAGCFRTSANAARHLLVRRVGGLLLAFEHSPNVERIGGQILIPTGPGRFLAASGGGAYVIDGAGAQTPADALVRRQPDAAVWRAWLGMLHAEPPIGETTELIEQDGRLALHVLDPAFPAVRDGRWGRVEVVPLSDDNALALIDVTFGTLLRRDQESLRWTLYDGSVSELTRSK